jgi:hypothetical protein
MPTSSRRPTPGKPGFSRLFREKGGTRPLQESFYLIGAGTTRLASTVPDDLEVLEVGTLAEGKTRMMAIMPPSS